MRTNDRGVKNLPDLLGILDTYSNRLSIDLPLIWEDISAYEKQHNLLQHL